MDFQLKFGLGCWQGPRLKLPEFGRGWRSIHPLRDAILIRLTCNWGCCPNRLPCRAKTHIRSEPQAPRTCRLHCCETAIASWLAQPRVAHSMFTLTPIADTHLSKDETARSNQPTTPSSRATGRPRCWVGHTSTGRSSDRHSLEDSLGRLPPGPPTSER